MAEPTRDEDLEALFRQFQASELTELYVRTGGFELFLARDSHAAPPWTNRGPSSPPAPTARETPAPRETRKVESGARVPPSPPGAAQKAAEPTFELPEGYEVVSAPYLGTFYRSPKPGAAHFVEIGDTVKPGDDLCLVEVMKLFTAVKAASNGIVRHVYATDGQMVKEGQPLFALEPAG